MTSLQFKRLMGSIVTKVSGTTPPPLVKPPSKSQTRIGVVHSTKMERTVSVIVERLVKHPKWKKYVRKRKKYKMHHEANYSGNERNWLKPGDVVKMVSTKPKAKTVFWELYASAGGLLRAGRERKLEDIERKIAEKVKSGEIITEDEKSFALSRSKMKSGRGFAAGGGGVEE
jgi:small subunit ribosomal protein S17